MDPYGVPEEIRTPGPRLRRPLLYPTELQVHIIIFFFIKMVSHTGIEPVTPWLKVKCSTDWANGSYFGAGDEGRTRDIQLGRLTLYQLSYSRIIWFVVPRAGLEPARDKFPQDFKSCASTDFATKALVTLFSVFLLLTHNYSISISYLNYIVNTFFQFFYIFLKVYCIIKCNKKIY